ncbi:MAG: DNA-directed RNA polymerase subunit beta' [Candidatus Coatesbacteria bacterium]|nr:DNA-directed RNA polymerase subunit beta' [Candidatus Coatesbacteria bacterium]
MKKATSRKLDFEAIRIGLASSDRIRQWSYGEVVKPETINYRTFKPEAGGLFCEKIFGPIKDYECNCGKYKRIRYKGVVCEKCGVEVTLSKVRRDRLGHITLAVPVAHIWFFKAIPCRIGHVLNRTSSEIERVVYYESYIVIDPSETDYKTNDIINEEQYRELQEKFPNGSYDIRMGAEALRDALRNINLDDLADSLRDSLAKEKSKLKKTNLLKRLEIIEDFRASRKNKLDWMILEVLPVLPPELRPLVPLEGGRFATSDLNDLYRRVINRNNRLKKLLKLRAPEVILRNEKRMLQEAVDALLDNSRRSKPILGSAGRPLKSLSDMLKGKRGRFRLNLLGKRVDYSGRAVIVVGPELSIGECGLPKTMAKELFKPFIMKKLKEKDIANTFRSAKKMAEKDEGEVWDLLEEIIEDHPVLLNRAPTLHRLSVQAFQPRLIEGNAIKIPPMVCEAFNADFDGDQMAIHVPLSVESQLECRLLCLSSYNLLSPANGTPIARPRQDMVLGLYYMTKEKNGVPGEGMIFNSKDEVIRAFDSGKIDLHARIKVKNVNKIKEDTMKNPEDLHNPAKWNDYTTVGRILFNSIVPDDFGYYDVSSRRNHASLFGQSGLRKLVGEVFRYLPADKRGAFLDSLKDLGFTYATWGGLTIGIDDLEVPGEKEKIIQKTEKEVNKVWKMYNSREITDRERYNIIVDLWTRATIDVSDAMLSKMRDSNQGFNPVYMMLDSGARGSQDQIKQLAGMRGLMAKPQKKMTGGVGEIIETPIKSNLKEGLSVLEYFIGSHGARKGLADTALKTADAGYLTRRLVDVAQDVIITEEDCGTIKGIEIEAIKEGEDVIESLAERIAGRYSLEDIYHSITDELLVEAGQEITEEIAQSIEDANIQIVKIRSVLTCDSKKGLCKICYGKDLAIGRIVDIGEAVGVVAAQSIGEPGTQLTLRTFHIGGTAGSASTESQIEVKNDGIVEFDQVESVMHKNDQTGLKERIVIGRNSLIRIRDQHKQKEIRVEYKVPYGAIIEVKDKELVEKGRILFRWDPYADYILADKEGKIEYFDMFENLTYKEDVFEGKRQIIIIESKDKSLQPQLGLLVHGEKETYRKYTIPNDAFVLVKEGQMVEPGDTLVRIPKEISKVWDITSGLPRVVELFEARRPKFPAVVSEINGKVEIGRLVRGYRKIKVIGEDGTTREYSIPQGKFVRVHDGDKVVAGEKLCEGPIDPRDILRIKGPHEVQKFLVNAVQEVYRLQGVNINDKHIAVIVRQMLRKVKIIDSGDTEFLEGNLIDRIEFEEINKKIEEEEGKPAKFEPILLGITKAALNTESFMGAASFQETTKVLTDAAIQGRIDLLQGLKENIIMGNIIPAGTGIRIYRDLDTNPLDVKAVEEELDTLESEEDPLQLRKG